MFGTGLSGILLTNLPVSISLAEYASLINYVHNHQMKIGVSLEGVNDWPLQVVHNFDYVELFHGTFAEFSTNCGSHGPGPFCRSGIVFEISAIWLRAKPNGSQVTPGRA